MEEKGYYVFYWARDNGVSSNDASNLGKGAISLIDGRFTQYLNRGCLLLE